jgi:hypothetical protein
MPKPFVASWPSNLSSLIAVVGLLGLGCSDEGHRLGGVGYRIVDGLRVGACRDGADIEPVDFMEDGDATIELTQGRAGNWFSFNDRTTMATQWPQTDAEVFTMTALRPPRGESQRAAWTEGKGFEDWGAGIGFELKSQKPYDLSGYAGVTFWARQGEGHRAPVRFAVTDPLNAPRGGHCQPEQPKNPPCDNYFGAELDLDTEFRSYRYEWSQLAQEPWGYTLTQTLDPAAIYGFRFQLIKYEGVPLMAFDFTIDDVALLCNPL